MTNPGVLISVRRALFENHESKFSALTPVRRAAGTRNISLGTTALVQYIDGYPYSRYLNTTATACPAVIDPFVMDTSAYSVVNLLHLRASGSELRSDFDSLSDGGLIDVQLNDMNVQWVTYQGDSFTLVHNKVDVQLGPSGEITVSLVTATEAISGETVIETTPNADSSTSLTAVAYSFATSLSSLLTPATIRQVVEGIFIAAVVIQIVFLFMQMVGIQVGLVVLDLWAVIDVAIAITLAIAMFLFVVAFQSVVDEGWTSNEFATGDPPGSPVLDVLRGPEHWYSFSIGSVSAQPHANAVAVDRAVRVIGVMGEFSHSKGNQSVCLCVLIMLLTLRLTKFVEVIPSFGYVAKILKKSLLSVLIVGFILGLVFIESVSLAIITLGSHLKDFSSLSQGFLTLFNVISVCDLWDDPELFVYSDYLPWMFFFRMVFSFCFVFVANNLIVAIIVEAALDEHAKTVARKKALDEGIALPKSVMESEEEMFERELASLHESIGNCCRLGKSKVQSHATPVGQKEEDDEDDDEDWAQDFNNASEVDANSRSIRGLLDEEEDHKAVKDNAGRQLVAQALRAELMKEKEMTEKKKSNNNNNKATDPAHTTDGLSGGADLEIIRLRSNALSSGGLDSLSLDELTLLASDDQRVSMTLAVPFFEVTTEELLMFKAFVSRVQQIAEDGRDSLRHEAAALKEVFAFGEELGGIKNDSGRDLVDDVIGSLAAMQGSNQTGGCLGKLKSCFASLCKQVVLTLNGKREEDAEVERMCRVLGVSRDQLVSSKKLRPWTLSHPIVSPYRLRLVQQGLTDLVLLQAKLFRIQQEVVKLKDQVSKSREITKQQLQIANALELRLRSLVRTNTTLQAGSDLAAEFATINFDAASKTDAKVALELLSKDALQDEREKKKAHARKVKEWRAKEGFEDPLDIGEIDPNSGLPLNDLAAVDEILRLKVGLPPNALILPEGNNVKSEEKRETEDRGERKKEKWALTVAENDVKESKRLERRLKKSYLSLEEQNVEPIDWTTLRSRRGGHRRPSFIVVDEATGEVRIESSYQEPGTKIPNFLKIETPVVGADAEEDEFSKFVELLDLSDQEEERAAVNEKQRNVLSEIFDNGRDFNNNNNKQKKIGALNQQPKVVDDDDEVEDFDEDEVDEDEADEDEADEEEEVEFVFTSSRKVR
eukprot:GDKJ01054275.1.p1 GENE.GDKJ01054275.1~~GDKJ01054275.1.p1  ORF type:complete len:1212 (-),score=308.25 GDKJ01054275.1:131-3634(-)